MNMHVPAYAYCIILCGEEFPFRHFNGWMTECFPILAFIGNFLFGKCFSKRKGAKSEYPSVADIMTVYDSQYI